jgi:hypothetical protein
MINFKLTDDREWYKQVVSGIFLTMETLINAILILIGAFFIYLMILVVVKATAWELLEFILTLFSTLIGIFAGVLTVGYAYLWSTDKLHENEQIF